MKHIRRMLHRPFLIRVGALALTLGLIACGDDTGETLEPPDDALIVEPLGEFPDQLSDTFLFPRAPDLTALAPGVVEYEPRWPLWSNGSLKLRHVVLPEGAVVDNSDAELWEFPVGTLFFKTFLYPDDSFESGWRPYETRILRRTEDGWDFGSYQWNEEGTDAFRLDMREPVSVAVTTADGDFTHEIPNRFECRQCHEGSDSFILGFNELQLNTEGSDGVNVVRELEADGWFSEPLAAELPEVDHVDPDTEEILGYLVGNCVHCHNGQDHPSASFDLRPPVALEHLINAPTESSASAEGIRVIPGDPDQSIMYLAVAGEETVDGIKSMPPVGVQLRDDATLQRLRAWIENLEEAP